MNAAPKTTRSVKAVTHKHLFFWHFPYALVLSCIISEEEGEDFMLTLDVGV